MRILPRVLSAVVITATLTPWPAGLARADSVGLPIRATIVQCGARDEIRLSCQRDDRCCVFMDRVPVADTDADDVDALIPTEMARADIAPSYRDLKSASAPSTRP